MNRAEMAVAFGRGCGFASGRLLGATGPRMESYNWKAKPISPCLGVHEAHPKTTLYGVVFQKLNGPLLTSAPQSPPGSKAAERCIDSLKTIARYIEAKKPKTLDEA